MKETANFARDNYFFDRKTTEEREAYFWSVRCTALCFLCASLPSADEPEFCFILQRLRGREASVSCLRKSPRLLIGRQGEQLIKLTNATSGFAAVLLEEIAHGHSGSMNRRMMFFLPSPRPRRSLLPLTSRAVCVLT